MSDLSGIGSPASVESSAQLAASSSGSAVAQDAQSAPQASAPSVGTYAAIMVLLDSVTEKVSASASSTAESAGQGVLVDDWA